MAWRSNETPMEFEYNNGVGDLDHSESRSPFAKMASQHKAGTLDRNFGSAWKSPTPARQTTFKMPDVPPQTPKAPPAVFRENINTDFSSAAESSPDAGNGADNEDTPEQQRISNVTFFRGSSPRKGKTPPARRQQQQQTWLQRLKTSKPHAELMKKAQKRKRREVEREDRTITSIRHGSDDTYNDDDSSRPSSADGQKPSKSKNTKDVGTIAAILSFVHEHPRLPIILAFYGQCLFSFFILTMLGWMIWGMYSAVLQQIEVEAELLGQDALREIEHCRKSWFDNSCGSEIVPPALQGLCAEWDHCRNQDWRAKGRAKIGAHTFAQILNSFVEPLSYKLIVLVLACLALLVMSPYTLFNPVRKASDMHFQQQQQQQQQPQPPFYPQTPSRQMQSEWANAGAMATGFFTPQAGRQWGENDWGSPSKRLEGRSRSPVKQIDFQRYS